MQTDQTTDIPESPFDWITQILAAARQKIQTNPWAMILATADKDGRPSSRTVLLKHFDQSGFVFFTNSQSKKGRQLAENPHASLTFYLPALKKQIQVEGTVVQIPATESDAYWQTRSRESQIGAWASAQSREIADRDEVENRDEFEKRYEDFEKKFQSDSSIPRPGHWNGYRVVPSRIEFWFEGEHRLHRRYSYSTVNGSWHVARLFP